jgi:hypothetical protein
MITPKLVEREYKVFDWVGWILAITGLTMMTYFGGVFGNTPNWWLFVLSILCTWDNITRVAFGRVKKYIYYDTIIHNLYEIEVEMSEFSFFVSAASEEDLEVYMDIHYTGMKYAIIRETHAESFIKSELDV